MRAMVTRLCLSIAAVCVSTASLPLAVARADFASSEYSYPSSSCSGAIDPVTLVLYGVNADRNRARSLVQAETGWTGDDSSSQYARSHGFCTPMDGESYQHAGLVEDRHHVRYNQTHHRDDKGRLETVGTPHRDSFTYCGHVASSYISTRNAVLFAMNPPYGYSYQYWGNKAAMEQCDGRLTASDGYVLWVNIG